MPLSTRPPLRQLQTLRPLQQSRRTARTMRQNSPRARVNKPRPTETTSASAKDTSPTTVSVMVPVAEDDMPMATVRDIRKAIWAEPIICKLYATPKAKALANAITD